jgi:hypothetical protein
LSSLVSLLFPALSSSFLIDMIAALMESVYQSKGGMEIRVVRRYNL